MQKSTWQAITVEDIDIGVLSTPIFFGGENLSYFPRESTPIDIITIGLKSFNCFPLYVTLLNVRQPIIGPIYMMDRNE